MDYTVPFSIPSPHGFPTPFMPLTPSQSGSDSMNNRSPSETFDDRLSSVDRFSSFDFTQGFGGPQHPFFGAAHPSGLHGPQGPTPPASDGSSSTHAPSDLLVVKPDHVNELPMPIGGSEEDDSQTPAQCRRKAQNRAAQRAFRERKEKHIKDLEAKLAYLEAAQKQAANENEQLRQDLQKISTENEILRATSSATLRNNNGGNGHASTPEQITTGPMIYKPTDFYSKLLQDQLNKFPSHRIITSDDGQKLFAAGATWDYIVGHALYKKGQVDILKVCDLIKNRSKCDGQGPVFAEKDIESAIEQAAGGSDDLL